MPHIERLHKLADHLLHGKLGHAEFDFSRYNDSGIARCGTAGCAIGECPIVWPDHWRFNNEGFPVLGSNTSIELSGKLFFEIGTGEYEHLFTPMNQMPGRYGGTDLFDTASKEQVANNILEFIKVVSK